MRIYIGNSCLNRNFDTQRNMKLRLEAEATWHILTLVKQDKLELVWSYLIDYENSFNPNQGASLIINEVRKLANIYVKESAKLVEDALLLSALGLKSKSSLHLASAVSGASNYFISTDSTLIDKYVTFKNLHVVNPLTFISKLEA